NMQTTIINLLDDPAVGGIVTVSRDVTEQRLAEEARASALARERQARTSAEQTLDQLLSLRAVADLLAGALTPARVAAIVVEQGVSTMDAIAGAVGQLDADEQNIELIAYHGRSGSAPR